MRIQDTNEILNESKIMRNQNDHDGNVISRKTRMNNKTQSLPPVLRDWRFHLLVAGVITAGVTAAKVALDRRREFSF